MTDQLTAIKAALNIAIWAQQEEEFEGLQTDGLDYQGALAAVEAFEDAGVNAPSPV